MISKATLFWIAIALAIFGAAITAGRPAWGTVTGVAILLLAGAIAAGTIGAGAIPARSEDYIAGQLDRRAGNQKISSSLVGLSSAAILAVYAAGYHRTGSAADQFEAAQTARRRAVAPIAAPVMATNAAPIAVKGPGAISRSAAALPKKGRARSSTVAIARLGSAASGNSQSAGLAPSTAEQPTVVSSAATGSSDPAGATASPAGGTSKPHYKDGTYFGLGTSNHGDIQAAVVIQEGKIASAAIAVCATRYPCSWIVDLPGQVVAKQSAYVDFVSGATESSDAFSYAVASALSKARE